MRFHPNPSSSSSSSLPPIVSLLKSCRTSGHLHQVHAHIIQTGLEQDHCIASQFILLSSSLSSLSYCTSFFRRILWPTAVLWNSLLKGFSQKSSCADVLSVFTRMRRAGVVPDRFTYPLVVKSCGSEYRLREGRAVHAMAVGVGLDCDVFVGTALLDLYGKCREIECAGKLFELISERNVVSWTAMVSGYLNVGDVGKAKLLFDEMPLRSVRCWNAMIDGLVRVGDLKGASKLFEEMPERNIVSFTTMIDGYSKAGDVKSARTLFELAPKRDLVAWSSMISGYAQNGLPNEAVKVFIEMLSKNVMPDEFILVGLMSACSQVGCSQLVEWVDSYVSQSSIDLHRPHVAAALVGMNAKCGHIDRAMKLFEELPKRDVVSYCSMMQGLSMHGHGTEVISLFNKMLEEGLTPDDVAFTIVLIACSRAGLVDEGLHFFKILQSAYARVLKPVHYACVVDLLSRAGRLKAAYELLNTIPVNPSASAWSALLGGCNLHGDTKLGEKVAHRLLELEPQNAGNYVMLSNILASADRWVDVSLLRSQMKQKGVEKTPGWSMIS